MLIPFTKLMVAAAPADSDVVVDAKATLPQGLWSNMPTPGRMDRAAAAECGAIRPLPPSPGGAGRVEGPLSATATLTTAAITTTAATIALTKPACNRCSTSGASAPVSASNAACNALRAATNPAAANTNAASAVNTIPRVPYGCNTVVANSYATTSTNPSITPSAGLTPNRRNPSTATVPAVASTIGCKKPSVNAINATCAGSPAVTCTWVNAPCWTTTLSPNDSAAPLSEPATTTSSGCRNDGRPLITSGAITTPTKAATGTSRPNSRIRGTDGR